MRLSPVKDRDLVSAAEGITDLKRAGKPGAAQNENTHRLGRLLLGAGPGPKPQSHCSAGDGGDLDEVSSRGGCHLHVQHDRRVPRAQPTCSRAEWAAFVIDAI